MNYGKTVKAWSAGLIFSVATSFASAGPIATMDLKYQGFSIGSKTGWIYKDSDEHTVEQHVAAGMFKFSVSGYEGADPLSLSSKTVLDAFCVDINTALEQSSFVKYSLLEADHYFNDSSIVDRIGRLYTGYRGLVTDKASSAAFQLALWEIINEDAGELTLFENFEHSFHSTPFDSAQKIANPWLASLSEQENNFNLFVLSSEMVAGGDEGEKRSQDLLVFSPSSPVPVPEPGTLALLALGICGLLLRKASKRSKD